jgi:signal peptidase I
MQNQVSDKNSSQQPDGSWMGEVARTLVLSLVLALGIRSFVAEARWIPSGSMEPTLHGSPNQWEADKIIVDKLSYKFSNPQRGDIVVFNPTKELQSENYQDAFIKRIVGLPGETVEIRDGKLYVNDKALSEDNYVKPVADERNPQIKPQTPVLTSVDVCQTGLQPPFLSQSQKIPENSYLVLGDNRRSSYDGRCWGLVPREKIIGRAVVRFWPLNNLGGIDNSPLYPPQ